MYVYRITNLINQKNYIGVTTRTVEERFKEHWHRRNDKERNSAISAAMLKYGFSNFKVELLETVKDIEELFKREQYWIKYFNSYNNGYNLTEGGEGFSYREDIIIEEVLELYKETRSSVKVAEILGCGENTILRRLQSAGILADRGLDIIAKEIIYDYQTPMTKKDVQLKYDIKDVRTLNKLLLRYNVIEHTFQYSILEGNQIFDYYLKTKDSFTSIGKKFNMNRKLVSKLIYYKLKI